MFAPPFRRVPPSPGLSSVLQWILRYAVLIAVLFAVATCAKDLCPNNQADFPKVVHTIGPIDGHLWAITTDNWTVYELTPCKADNDSLVHCMEVGVPVSIDSKWPELAKAVKEAANVSDFNITVDNSLIGISKDFKDTVLVLRGSSFQANHLVGFAFGINRSLTTSDVGSKGLWISSDVEDISYKLVDKEYPKSVSEIYFSKEPHHNLSMIFGDYDNSLMYICNVTKDGLEVLFSKTKCAKEMAWTVVKGVHYQHQFYFFASDKVYIFSDKAETEASKVQVMSYADFLHCKAPTTMVPQSTHSNKTEATKSETTKVEPNPVTKVAKVKVFNLSDHLVLIIFSVVGVVLIVFFLVYCCWWKKRDTNQSEKVESKLRSAEPNKVVKDPVSAIKSKIQSKVPKESSKVGGSKIASKTKAKCLSKVKDAKATSNAMKSSIKVGSIASLVFPKNAIKRLSKSAPKVY